MITGAHHKISTLRNILPGGFLFILDITDRSFLYKSKECKKSEDQIMSLEVIHGLDKLTRDADLYSHENEDEIIKIHKISNNTFLGLCAPKNNYSAYQWSSVDHCLNNLN